MAAHEFAERLFGGDSGVLANEIGIRQRVHVID
jgi:hypothetical protein